MMNTIVNTVRFGAKLSVQPAALYKPDSGVSSLELIP
jgi:hypothetical protein